MESLLYKVCSLKIDLAPLWNLYSTKFVKLPGPGRTAAATAGSRWWPTMPPRGGSVRDCLFSTGDVSPSSKSPGSLKVDLAP